MTALFDPKYEESGAEFDEPDRQYRYRLWRKWALSPGRTVLWIMLNPSTADESVLDPTLRRCEKFSRDWGYDGFEVANLFALRSTDPEALRTHRDPVGPENDQRIRYAAEGADLVVCGWGTAQYSALWNRHNQVVAHLKDIAVTPWCLGQNQDGTPRHPLYVPGRTPAKELTL